MGFSDEERLLELTTHEFGHSFVNPIIYGLSPEVLKQTESLFTPIKEDMKKQAYTTWSICLAEHFVRAGEIIIAKRMGNMRGAEELKTHYITNRKFIYLPEIIKHLESGDKPYPQGVKQALENMKVQP
jgi:hypothetical protein